MIHAKYSPSKLERIIACPGSVGLGERLPPEPSTSYAEEGTLLHSIMAECIEQWPNYDLDSINWESLEHRFLVSQCLEQLKQLLESMKKYKIYQDMRVYMRDVDVNGTLDVGIECIDHTGLTNIHIIDFKFGEGIEVSPTDNPQGLAYLDGFCNFLKYNPLDSNQCALPMFFWIYQPRFNKFECEQIFPDELKYFSQRVEKAIRLAEGRNPPYHPGEKQCKWCPAGAVCKARMTYVKQNAADVLSAFADQPSWDSSIESIESLSKLLKTKSSIDSAMKAIQEHLFTQLSRGHKVPGYKLVPGRTSRSWATGVNALSLSDLFPGSDITDFMESKLLSPAKVEKMLTPQDRKILAELIVRNEGEPTMASEDSVKEAINPFADFV